MPDIRCQRLNELSIVLGFYQGVDVHLVGWLPFFSFSLFLFLLCESTCVMVEYACAYLN